MAGSERRVILRSYLLTFSCYGARLHGDELGSVDREHRVPGTPYAAPDALRLAAVTERMTGKPYRLDAAGNLFSLGFVKVVSAGAGMCWRRTFGQTTCMRL